VETWETGGCVALKAYGVNIGQTIGLEDDAGKMLCAAPDMGSVSSGEGFPSRVMGKQVGQQYVWRVPATSISGKRYVFC